MSNLVPQSTSTASATGNPRNKTALKPGHSLMDWIRLRTSGVDLAGTKGVVTPVTLAELKKHNKKNDAWMAIRGKVYNVTRYMDFHPGGVDELMKGVGMDATKIFDDVHAWVNYDQMLNKCYIGPLCAYLGSSSAASSSASSKLVSSSSSSQLSTGSTLTANFRLPFSISANNFISNNSLGQSSSASSNQPTALSGDGDLSEDKVVEVDAPPIVPRFDWIQKTTDLVIIFYTRAFCNPGLIIECLDTGSSSVEVKIFLEGGNGFLVKLTLTESIQWPCTVRNNVDSGKIEISFKKSEPKLWSSYGTMEMTKLTETDLKDYEYEVGERLPLNHDSFALTLKPVDKFMMYILPIGYHISATCQLSAGSAGPQEISRSYTPVPHTYLVAQQLLQSRDILLLIKSYDNGTLSKHLCHQSSSGTGSSRLKISPPMGNFSMLQLKSHTRMAFLAAGSGITPFLGIIDQFVNKPSIQLESMSLLYFNKTEADIWSRPKLDAIAQAESRVQIKYILSDAESSWEGERGRVTRDQIVALTDPQSKDHVTYIGVCGPPAFNRSVVEFLKAVGFPATSQHIFQG